MDNQQERLIWLAGFIDGEGCISLVEQRSGKKKQRQVTPRVLLANTNVPALRRIEQILEENNLAYYVGWRQPGVHGNGKLGHYLWAIQIAGAKRIKRLLEKILPYLVVKKEQAEITYDWVKWVVERPRNIKQNTVLGQSTNPEKYLQADREVKARVSKLNQNPQRLYAEHANKYVREDIVRSEMKVSEVSRND